jgi:sortase A
VRLSVLRVLKVAQYLCFAVGIAVLTYSGGSVAYAQLYQNYQAWEFDNAQTAVGPNFEPVRDGDLLGRLDIPRIGVSVMVLEGVESGTLRVAAGHVPGTPLPGSRGNVAIAAHRDTFFRKLQKIHVADRISVSTLRKNYEYVVYSTEIVDPEDIDVLRPKVTGELTLVTCYPFYYIGLAPKRFIVHSLLVN